MKTTDKLDSGKEQTCLARQPLKLIQEDWCSPSTQEAEASASPWFRDQPELQTEFLDHQGYTEKPSLKKKKSKTKQTNKPIKQNTYRNRKRKRNTNNSAKQNTH